MSRAVLAVLSADPEAISGQAFNVGRSEENYQVRDLAEIVEETVGDCEIEYAGNGDPDPRSYRVDFTRFDETFPDAGLRWNARDGARELVDAYREIGLTLDEFEGDRYIRLKHLRLLLDRGDLDPELRWRAARVP
jgi:nucleoside-diphosphate-sugar epimerase